MRCRAGEKNGPRRQIWVLRARFANEAKVEIRILRKLQYKMGNSRSRWADQGHGAAGVLAGIDE